MIISNEQDFVDDFKNGGTAKQLKEKYCLSNRQYNKLKRKYKLMRGNSWTQRSRMGTENFQAKNYVKLPNGKFAITKSIAGTNTYFCCTNTEDKAKQIVKKLRECDWDKSEVYRILYEVEKGVEYEAGRTTSKNIMC